MCESPWQRIAAVLRTWEHLGCQQIRNRASLIGYVPHVGSRAYLHTVYRGLTNEQVASSESELGASFPVSFKQFLHVSNGSHFYVDALRIFGRRTSYARTGDEAYQPYDIIALNSVFEKPQDAHAGICRVGSYDWDGSSLYFNAQGKYPDRIVRCSRESIAPLNVWEDFWSMLEAEVGRISQLFDDQGRLIEPDQPTAPRPNVG
jgi:hypothetical protein